MQEASGFGIFGQVSEDVGFNANVGFVRPRVSGGVDNSNYLNTESDFDIQAENDDDIILDQ
jgi:hypothetical protein